nr:hypothetical protein [Halomonas shengliensis]
MSTPYTYLVDVHQRVALHPTSRVDELTPRRCRPTSSAESTSTDALGKVALFPMHEIRCPMRIDDMSLDQLLALNDLICRRIDELQARQEMEVLSRLTLGQAVSFESREGQVFGRVIKINRKTVLVQSEDQRQWKVAVALIQPLRDV